MRGNDIGGKKDDGKGGVQSFFWVVEILHPDIYLVFIVIFQPAGKEKGPVRFEGQQPVLFDLQTNGGILHKEKVLAGIPVDLQLVDEGAVDM